MCKLGCELDCELGLDVEPLLQLETMIGITKHNVSNSFTLITLKS